MQGVPGNKYKVCRGMGIICAGGICIRGGEEWA